MPRAARSSATAANAEEQHVEARLRDRAAHHLVEGAQAHEGQLRVEGVHRRLHRGNEGPWADRGPQEHVEGGDAELRMGQVDRGLRILGEGAVLPVAHDPTISPRTRQARLRAPSRW
jgi:hypothetical protein